MAEKLKQRADGRYARQVTIGMKNGKPVKKTVYGTTQSEVNKKYRELLNSIDSGTDLSLEKMTVKQLCEQWFAVTKKGKLRSQSERYYTYNLPKIYAAFGDKRAKDVRDTDVIKLIGSVQEKGTIATAKNLLCLIRSVYNYAISIGLVFRNPCMLLSVEHETSVRRSLSELEKKRLERAELTVKERMLIDLLLYTGMRIGEALALTKSDIDFENKTITVNKTVVFNSDLPLIQHNTKTKAGMRQIPIFTPLFTTLWEYCLSCDSELLIARKGEIPYTYCGARHIFDCALSKAGITENITCHVMRHTFVSDCYRAGIPLKKTQLWVGHSSSKMTLDIYTHLSEQEQLDASDMNDFYTRKSNRKSTDDLEVKTFAN